jgi:Putative prokaryotic signal transducing protein
MPKSPSFEESRKSIASGGGGGVPPSAGDDGGGGGGGGGDKLVKVAFAPNQMEAEMIQGLLSDHGIQSMLKRGPGFDVPEFLASGPRQVFVLESAAALAREVLEGMPGAG